MRALFKFLTFLLLWVWCLLVVLGLLIGRRLGLLVTGGKHAKVV